MQQVQDIEIDLLLEAVFLRYGYDFRHYARASVTRRVKSFLAKSGFKKVSEMIPQLLYDELFFEKLVQDMSITVTEMFRDAEFFKVLREKVIPHLKTYPFVKIWHAGCATGEEVYSLAIVLQEEGFYDRATIFATDFNQVALDKARQGVYRLDRMKDFTANYQRSGGSRSFSEYYHARYDSVIINQSLKRNITFAHHNLVTDTVFSEMHFVLCRNVLIYFDKALQDHVLKLFYESLIHGGTLALGSKESLKFSGVEKYFKDIDEKWKIFRKAG
ncbi:MAG: protein-glutamate O-methyltransferase CheR [Deltaproteobacteria bacterium]|nr:protein-glutamate O-methyltransferase CheR [Deltaproteobacteria bacterium]